MWVATKERHWAGRQAGVKDLGGAALKAAKWELKMAVSWADAGAAWKVAWKDAARAVWSASLGF
jgi:hypothetical protein